MRIFNRCCWLQISLLLSFVSYIASTAQADGPHWIGPKSPAADRFQCSSQLDIDPSIQAAELKFAADGCHAQVMINELVLSVEPHAPTQQLDVTRSLRRGLNRVTIEGRPTRGPLAVALSLTILNKDGTRRVLHSDDSWSGAKSLGLVRPELWGLNRRSAIISPLEDYEQWKQSLDAKATRPARLWTAPGFTITPVRVAQNDEGSWISLAFDPQGRAVISREDAGLLRMTLDEQRTQVTKVEPLAPDLKECRGLVFAHDRLYVSANNSLAHYQLRFDAAGRVSELKKTREFAGKTGHGRNDLTQDNHDGLYAIFGDSVAAPESLLRERTSPLRESRKVTPRREGFLMHFDHNGENGELICSGLRNPYGVAVNRLGDTFTYDADSEYDMGMPWYRPTRMVQLVSGADYGYRDATGSWPPNFPDHPGNGPRLMDVGRGSPTAVMFGYHLKFPQPYRDALFVLDWSYGRVLAMHASPRGARYRSALELFLQGQPLNVTDLAAGPDGALYLITGGRKTQSTLYRVTFTGSVPPSDIAEPFEQASAQDASELRATRQMLEAYHGRVDPRAIDAAWPYLGSADPVLRHAARIAIEQQAPAQWLPRALAKLAEPVVGDESRTAQFTLALSVMQLRDATNVAPIVQFLQRQTPNELDVTTALTLVHLYQQLWTIDPIAIESQRSAIVSQLLRLAPPLGAPLRVGHFGTSDELRRRIAYLLGDLQAAEAVPLVVNTLLVSSVQEDRLAGLFSLRHQTAGMTTSSRRQFLTTLHDSRHMVGGQGLPIITDQLRKNFLATLTPRDQTELADVLEPPPIQDEPLGPPRPVVQRWTVADLTSLSATLVSAGSVERGEAVFRAALCSRCHRSGANGPAVGPDLTFVARRFSRRDMLESILTPSLAVAENYRNVQVVTTAGVMHTGRIVSEGDFRKPLLKMNTDPLRPSQSVEIDKREIEESRILDTSPMPQNLLDSFTLAEINDLLAYLEAGATGR